MQSIRNWLAGVVRNDAAPMRRGMAIWLTADATLDLFRGVAADQTWQLCHRVLKELRGWLDDDQLARIARARATLGGLRACLLARSYLLEYLKQESYLDTKSRAEERTVVGLLDTFFVDDTAFPKSLAPTLPSTGHADRARAGTEPPEP